MMKPKGPKTIDRFSDLLSVRGQLESLIDTEYEVEGTVDVFPSSRYEFHSKEELDRVIGNITLYSSPYATMKGSFSLHRRSEH